MKAAKNIRPLPSSKRPHSESAKEYFERGPASLTPEEREYIDLWNDKLLTFTQIADHFGWHDENGNPNRNRAAGKRNTIIRKAGEKTLLIDKERKLLREWRGDFTSKKAVDAFFNKGGKIESLAINLRDRGFRFFAKPDDPSTEKQVPAAKHAGPNQKKPKPKGRAKAKLTPPIYETASAAATAAAGNAVATGADAQATQAPPLTGLATDEATQEPSTLGSTANEITKPPVAATVVPKTDQNTATEPDPLTLSFSWISAHEKPPHGDKNCIKTWMDGEEFMRCAGEITQPGARYCAGHLWTLFRRPPPKKTPNSTPDDIQGP